MGRRHEVKGNLKIEVYGLSLKSPEESGWKIKHNVPYRQKFVGGKMANFSRHFFLSRIFPDKNCPQWKFFLMKIFTFWTHFSKWKLKLKSRQPFRNDIPIVNVFESWWIMRENCPNTEFFWSVFGHFSHSEFHC